METQGQHGIRNPLFIYQGTAGYSVRATLIQGDGEHEPVAAYTIASPYSGTIRCGASQ